jgi:hypothetical protein
MKNQNFVFVVLNSCLKMLLKKDLSVKSLNPNFRKFKNFDKAELTECNSA